MILRLSSGLRNLGQQGYKYPLAVFLVRNYLDLGNTLDLKCIWRDMGCNGGFWRYGESRVILYRELLVVLMVWGRLVGWCCGLLGAPLLIVGIDDYVRIYCGFTEVLRWVCGMWYF